MVNGLLQMAVLPFVSSDVHVPERIFRIDCYGRPEVWNRVVKAPLVDQGIAEVIVRDKVAVCDLQRLGPQR